MSEFKALWKLALPIVISQVGFVTMGLVDTLLVGPLGPDALSALSLGNTFFFGIIIFGLGLLMSLDAYVSQAHGARDYARCKEGLAQGVWLALGVWPLLVAAMAAVPWALGLVGYDPAMIELTELYLAPLRWFVLPALLFKTYRCFLASVEVTRPLVIAALLANGANIALDLWFIEGGLGLPPLGVEGVAWATGVCRLVLFAPLFLAVHATDRFAHFPTPSWRPDFAVLRRLVVIGLPVGLQYTAEVGCFSAATILMGIKGTVPLAAHQVALNCASLVFMVPLSIGAAGSVRSGRAFGAGDPEGVRRAGWTAIASGVAFAAFSSAILALGRGPIASAYRVESEVFDLAVVFLLIAAAFQFADALQAVAMGVLRGLGDTTMPLVFVLTGFGVVAAPIGLLGAFVLGDDPVWIWYGLSAGLGFVAVSLVLRFAWQVRRLRAGAPVLPPHDAGPWSAPT